MVWFGFGCGCGCVPNRFPGTVITCSYTGHIIKRQVGLEAGAGEDLSNLSPDNEYLDRKSAVGGWSRGNTGLLVTCILRLLRDVLLSAVGCLADADG
jgi:hypothetical protein